MKHIAVFVSLLLLIASCAGAGRPARGDQATVDRGRAIAEANCGSCHTLSRSGESPRADAPPFRTLSQNYQVDDLEEALAEGISAGHPAMPQFQFSADDAHAIVVYLNSMQEHTTAPRD